MAIIVSGAVSAKTWNIKPGTDAIKNGITHASSGDTLNLTKGTYYEHDLFIQKNLIITGPKFTGSTPIAKIDAQKKGAGFFTWPKTSLTLKNLVLTNGEEQTLGAGVQNAGRLTINKCTISHNSATIDSVGGGIYNGGGCYLTIIDSNIYGNTAPNGGGGIWNDGTMNIYRTNINGNTGSYGGGIFTHLGGKAFISGSNINSNTATFGGGICNGMQTVFNGGVVNIIGSNINNNIASNDGGGLYNVDGGKVTMSGSAVIGNVGSNYGGAVFNLGGCSFTGKGCTFTGNSASKTGGAFSTSGTTSFFACNFKGNHAGSAGGALSNSGTMTVKGSNFILNSANIGNAVYNEGGDVSSRSLQFNRFSDPKSSAYEVYCTRGTMDARYNWWGSNSNPKSNIFGSAIFFPYLILKSNANPLFIKNGGISKIKTNLWYDSNGIYHNPANGHVLNGIRISFTTTLGSVTSSVAMVNGAATATLKSGIKSGIAYIIAKLDNQSVKKWVKIDATAPKVSATLPTNLKTGVSKISTIFIKFSENIKSSTYYNSIKVKNLSTGKYVTITKAISGTYLNIKTISKRTSNTWYIVTIPRAAVKDYAGNNLIATYTFKFKTGT